METGKTMVDYKRYGDENDFYTSKPIIDGKESYIHAAMHLGEESRNGILYFYEKKGKFYVLLQHRRDIAEGKENSIKLLEENIIVSECIKELPAVFANPAQIISSTKMQIRQISEEQAKKIIENDNSVHEYNINDVEELVKTGIIEDSFVQMSVYRLLDIKNIQYSKGNIDVYTPIELDNLSDPQKIERDLSEFGDDDRKIVNKYISKFKINTNDGEEKEVYMKTPGIAVIYFTKDGKIRLVYQPRASVNNLQSIETIAGTVEKPYKGDIDKEIEEYKSKLSNEGKSEEEISVLLEKKRKDLELKKEIARKLGEYEEKFRTKGKSEEQISKLMQIERAKAATERESNEEGKLAGCKGFELIAEYLPQDSIGETEKPTTYLFVAYCGEVPEEQLEQDEGENVNSFDVTFPELLNLVDEGRIVDSNTVLAALALKRNLDKKVQQLHNDEDDVKKVDEQITRKDIPNYLSKSMKYMRLSELLRNEGKEKEAKIAEALSAECIINELKEKENIEVVNAIKELKALFTEWTETDWSKIGDEEKNIKNTIRSLMKKHCQTLIKNGHKVEIDDEQRLKINGVYAFQYQFKENMERDELKKIVEENER